MISMLNFAAATALLGLAQCAAHAQSTAERMDLQPVRFQTVQNLVTAHILHIQQ